MRKLFPFIIIALAIAVFLGRGVLLEPFGPDGAGEPIAGGDFAGPVDPETSGGSGAEVTSSAPASISVQEGSISKGASFFVEMRGEGVSPQDIHKVVRASKETFNFKKVRPGQAYTLFASADGGLDSLHYVIDAETHLKVTRSEDGFVTRTDTVPYHIEHYLTSGTIHSSIYESLVEQNANPELASYLAVIFQWDIDFFKDIRRGDTYTILYENKVLEDGAKSIRNVLAAKVFTQGREHYALGYRTADKRFNYYDTKGKSLQKSLLRAPLRYRRISSNFTHKRLHPVTRTYKPHLGVDYVAPVGTPVRSTGNGTVTEATRTRANGNYVKIRHNSRYTTLYLHLKGFAKGIRSGRKVSQGQIIGYLGGTGLVTAPHLHYCVKVGGRYVNPRTVRLPSKEPVPKAEFALFEVTRDSYLLRFFEANLQGKTVLVERPIPPLQNRMAVVF
jgi:murein DD-endopeptidase MepM/ murein hydrolase activator NlpD